MLIVMPFTRWENLGRVLELWRAQTTPARLVLVTTGIDMTPRPELLDVDGLETINTRPSIGAAKNAGMERARELGEKWVLFLDDDDYHGPRLVEAFARAAAEAPDDVHALSIGIRWVRFDDGLFLFSTPFAFCPGHCTAARVAGVPKFKTIPLGEDNVWSHELGMKHARQVGPAHFVYNRVGTHALKKNAARFKQDFGPCMNMGDVPDTYVDDEIRF